MTSNERATTMAIAVTAVATRLSRVVVRATRRPGAAARALRVGTAVAVALALSGCSLDSILKNDELPPNVTDPAITKTAEGAVAAYHGLIQQFRHAFGGAQQWSYVPFSGLLADELRLGGSELGRTVNVVDARAMVEGDEEFSVLRAFGDLQKIRGQASQAIGLLLLYAPDSAAITGHAYTLQAYAEILLAEAFCSGIPLSTLDYDGDFTPRPGSSTEEVYAHALALLDSALVMVGDDARLLNLARMAQARAHLGLGELDEASAAVADVPADWEYAVGYYVSTGSSIDLTLRNFAVVQSTATGWGLTVADGEGGNGLDYQSSGDPRTATTLLKANNGSGFALYHPSKYSTDGGTSILLASGVEARLIEAEAALAGGDPAWLTTLNALRTDGTFTTAADPAEPARQDTTWHAGSGGVEGLSPLEDPVTVEARVDLLFRERAFWLFLTGQRQADMRRLVRQYGRRDADVYPVGEYPSLTGASYGNDVNAPIPVEERVSNPLFTGCISRGA